MANNFNPNGQYLAEVDFNIVLNPKVTYDKKKVDTIVKNTIEEASRAINSAITTETVRPYDASVITRQVKELDARFGKAVSARAVHIIQAVNAQGNVFENGQYGHQGVTQAIKGLGDALSRALKRQVTFGITSANDIVKALDSVKPSDINSAELKTLTQTHLVSTQRALNTAIGKRREESAKALEHIRTVNREFLDLVGQEVNEINLERLSKAYDLTAKNTANQTARRFDAEVAKATRTSTLARDIEAKAIKAGNQAADLAAEHGQVLITLQQVASTYNANVDNLENELLAMLSKARKDAQKILTAAQKAGQVGKNGLPKRNTKKGKAYSDQYNAIQAVINDLSSDIDYVTASRDYAGEIKQKKTAAEAALSRLQSAFNRADKLTERLLASVDKRLPIAQLTQEQEEVIKALEGFLKNRGKDATSSYARNKSIIGRNNAQIQLLETFEKDFRNLTEQIYTKLYDGLGSDLKGLNTSLTRGLRVLLSGKTGKSQVEAIDYLVKAIGDNLGKVMSSGDDVLKRYGTKLLAFQSYLSEIKTDPKQIARLPSKAQDLFSTFGSYGDNANTFGQGARTTLKNSLESPFTGVIQANDEAKNAAGTLTKYLLNNAIQAAEGELKKISSSANVQDIHDAVQRLLQIKNAALTNLTSGLLNTARTLELLQNDSTLPALLAARKKVEEARKTVTNQTAGLPDDLAGRVRTAYDGSYSGISGKLDGAISSLRTYALDSVRDVFEHIRTSEANVVAGTTTARQAMKDFASTVEPIIANLNRIDPALGAALGKLTNSTRLYAGGKQEGLLDGILKQLGVTTGLGTIQVQDTIGVRDGSVQSIRELESRAQYDIKMEKIEKEVAKEAVIFDKYFTGLDNSLNAFNTRLYRLMGIVLSDTATGGQRENAIARIMQLIKTNVDAIESTGNKELVAYAKSLTSFHQYLSEALNDPNKLTKLPAQAATLYNTFNPYAVDTRPVDQKVKGAAAPAVRDNFKFNAQLPFKDARLADEAARKASESITGERLTNALTEVAAILAPLSASTTGPTELRQAAQNLLAVKNRSFRTLAANLLAAADELDKIGPESTLAQLRKAREKMADKAKLNASELQGLNPAQAAGMEMATKGAYSGGIAALDADIAAKKRIVFTEVEAFLNFASKQQADIVAKVINSEDALANISREANRIASKLAPVDADIASRMQIVGTAAGSFDGSNRPKQLQEGKNLLNQLVRSSGLDATQIKSVLTNFDTAFKDLEKIEQAQVKRFKADGTEKQKLENAENAKRAEERLAEIDKYLNSIANFSTAHPLKDTTEVRRALTSINGVLNALDANHTEVTLGDLNKRADQRIRGAIVGNKRATDSDDLGSLAKSLGYEDTLKNQELVAQTGILGISKRIKSFGYQVFQETFSNLTTVLVFQIGQMLGRAYEQAGQIENVVNDLSTVNVTSTGVIERSAETVKAQGQLRGAIAGATIAFKGGFEAANTYARGLFDLSYSTETIASNLDRLSKLARRSNRDLSDLTTLALPIDKLYGINNTDISAEVLDSARRSDVSVDKAASNFAKLAGNDKLRSAFSTEDLKVYAIASAKMGREVVTDVTSVTNALRELRSVKVEDANLKEVSTGAVVSTEALKAVNIQFNEFLKNIKASGVSTFFLGMAAALQAVTAPLQIIALGMAKLMNTDARPFIEATMAVAGLAAGFTALLALSRAALPILTAQVQKYNELALGATRAAGATSLLAVSSVGALGVMAKAAQGVLTFMTGIGGAVVAAAGLIYTVITALQNRVDTTRKATEEAALATKTINDELGRLAEARSVRLGIEANPKDFKFLEQLASGQLDFEAKLTGVNADDLRQLLQSNPDYLTAAQKERLADLTRGLQIAKDAAAAIKESMDNVAQTVGQGMGPFGQLAGALAAAAASAQAMSIALASINRAPTPQELAALQLPGLQYQFQATQANLQTNLLKAQQGNTDGYVKNAEDRVTVTGDINMAEQRQGAIQSEITQIEAARTDLKTAFDKIVNPTAKQREDFLAEDKRLWQRRYDLIDQENKQIGNINDLRKKQIELEMYRWAVDKQRIADQITVYEELQAEMATASDNLVVGQLKSFGKLSEADQNKFRDMNRAAIGDYFTSQINTLRQQSATLARPTTRRPLDFRKNPSEYDDNYSTKLQSSAKTINGDEIVASTLKVLQSYSDANNMLLESPEAKQIRQTIQDLERQLDNPDGVIWAQGRVQSLEQVKAAVASYQSLLDMMNNTEKVIRDLKFSGLGATDPVSRMTAQIQSIGDGITRLKEETSRVLNDKTLTATQFSAKAGAIGADLGKFIGKIRDNINNLQDQMVGLVRGIQDKTASINDEMELTALKREYTKGLDNPIQIKAAERRAEIEIELRRNKREFDRIQAQAKLNRDLLIDGIKTGLAEFKLAVDRNTSALNQKTVVPKSNIVTPVVEDTKAPVVPSTTATPTPATAPLTVEHKEDPTAPEEPNSTGPIAVFVTNWPKPTPPTPPTELPPTAPDGKPKNITIEAPNSNIRINGGEIGGRGRGQGAVPAQPSVPAQPATPKTTPVPTPATEPAIPGKTDDDKDKDGGKGPGIPIPLPVTFPTPIPVTIPNPSEVPETTPAPAPTPLFPPIEDDQELPAAAFARVLSQAFASLEAATQRVSTSLTNGLVNFREKLDAGIATAATKIGEFAKTLASIKLPSFSIPDTIKITLGYPDPANAPKMRLPAPDPNDTKIPALRIPSFEGIKLPEFKLPSATAAQGLADAFAKSVRAGLSSIEIKTLRITEMLAPRVALAANADGTVRFMSSETPTPTGSGSGGKTGSAPEPSTPPRSVPIGEGKNNFYTSKGVAALRSAAVKAGTPLYNYVSNPNNPVNLYGGAALNTLFGVDFALNTMSPEIMASNKVPKGVLADINAKTSNIKYGTKVSSVLMHVGPSPVQQFSSDPARNVLTGNPIYFVVGLEVQGNDGSLIKFSARARQQGVNISVQKGYTGDSRLALVTVKPTKNTLGQTDIEITGSCGGKADTVIVSAIMPGGSQIANAPAAPVAAAVTTAAATKLPAIGGGNPTAAPKLVNPMVAKDANFWVSSIAKQTATIDQVPEAMRADVLKGLSKLNYTGILAHGSPNAAGIMSSGEIWPGITPGSYSLRSGWTHAGYGIYGAQDNITLQAYRDTPKTEEHALNPQNKGAVSFGVAFPASSMRDFDIKDWEDFSYKYAAEKLGVPYNPNWLKPKSTDYLSHRDPVSGKYRGVNTSKETVDHWLSYYSKQGMTPAQIQKEMEIMVFNLTKDQFEKEFYKLGQLSPQMKPIMKALDDANGSTPLGLAAAQAYNAKARSEGVQVFRYQATGYNGPDGKSPTHYNIIDSSIMGRLIPYDADNGTLPKGFVPVENFNQSVGFGSQQIAKNFYNDPRLVRVMQPNKFGVVGGRPLTINNGVKVTAPIAPAQPVTFGTRLSNGAMAAGRAASAIAPVLDNVGMVGDIVGGVADRVTGAQAWLPPGLDQVPASLGMTAGVEIHPLSGNKVFKNKASDGYYTHVRKFSLVDRFGGVPKQDLQAKVTYGKGNASIVNGSDTAILTVKAYAPGVKVTLTSKRNPKASLVVALEGPTVSNAPALNVGVGGGIPVADFAVGMPKTTDYSKTPFAGGQMISQPTWQLFGTSKTTLPAGIEYGSIEGLSSDRVATLPQNHLGTDTVIQDGNVINPFYGAKVIKVSSGVGADGIANTEDDGDGDNYGNKVILQLANGFELLLAHLEDVMVKEGDVLNVGELIGTQGYSGNTGGEDHLHTELRKNGKIYIDPDQIDTIINELLNYNKDDVPLSQSGQKPTNNLNPDGTAGDKAIEAVAQANGLKPQTDVQQYDVKAQVVRIEGDSGPVQLIVPEGLSKGVTQAAEDADTLTSPDVTAAFEAAQKAYADAAIRQAKDEEINDLADAMIENHKAFLRSLKEVLRSGITSLLKFPQEIYKRQREKNDKLKEMTFQGASLDAQRASLRGSISDLQNKAARAKTVEEYNGYIQQLQQVEGQLRDINTQYAVWQEGMRQTKAEGAKFGEFFADLFEDLGTQIMNLFAERAGNMFMGALFPGEYNPGSTVFPTYQSAKAYKDNQGKGDPAFSTKYNPEGLGAATSPYGNSMAATYAQNDVATTITNGLNGVTEAVTKQGEEGTAVMKNGFAASLAASVEAIAVQLIIATAINIFRAAMTERQSDSKKFTAPLDFDTTRGTKNPTGIRNITVNTNISGANQSEVTRIASNEVDKGMNKVRFGV